MRQSTWISANQPVLRIAGMLLLAIWVVSAVFFGLGKSVGLQTDLDLKDIILFLVIGSITAALAVANFLWQTDLTRAALLRELTTKFFTDAGLYGAYNELVYNYEAETYRQVAAAVEAEVARHKGALLEPIFSGSEAWQTDRSGSLPPGKRRFHPFFFKGSPEEARLDALLSYLDLIAYHIEAGHLTKAEAHGGLGEIFTVVANKPFITEYLMYTLGSVGLVDPKASAEAGVASSANSSRRVSVLSDRQVTKLYGETLFQTLERQLDGYRKDTNEDKKNPRLDLDFRRQAIEIDLHRRNDGHRLFKFAD